MQEAVDQEVALADLEAGESITSVSYTHLDVYKRQYQMGYLDYWEKMERERQL